MFPHCCPELGFYDTDRRVICFHPALASSLALTFNNSCPNCLYKEEGVAEQFKLLLKLQNSSR